MARRATLLAALLLAAAIAVAWSNSLDGPFVLDDRPNSAENPTLRAPLDWGRVLQPPANASVAGRPLLNLSFALNFAVGGTAVRGYHVVNLALHIAAALVLFGLLRRTLLTRPLRGRFGGAAVPLAATATLLWALHPLQTESVTYVSQRAESLVGLCYLVVVYAVGRAAAPGASRGWPAVAVLACLAGVLTKEAIVTAPLVVLLYDRTFLAGSFRAAWRERRAVYLGLLAACGVLAWTMTGITHRGVAAPGAASLGYALTECRVLPGYLKLIAWPYPLVFDYGEFAVAPAAALGGALTVGALLGVVGFALRRRPPLGFAGAWFFLLLAPTSSVVPIAFQPMAENRLYLPLAAVTTTAVLLAYRLAGRRFALAGAGAIAVGALLTLRRNVDYQDRLALWAGTLAQRPDNFRAQNEYALSLAAAGRTDAAEASLRRSLAEHPDAATLHRNLAVVLMRRGEFEEAIQHFAAVVRLQPDLPSGREQYARAEIDLGLRLVQSGRPADALDHFQSAIRVKPDAADAHYALGNTLAVLGRFAAAAGEFEATLRLDPGYPGGRDCLARAQAALR